MGGMTQSRASMKAESTAEGAHYIGNTRQQFMNKTNP